MKARKFSLSQVLLCCAASVVLVLGLEWAAWRAGYGPHIRTVLLSAGRLGYRQARPNRTAVLNALIRAHGYRSYLEIGQGNRADNFDNVNCPIKIGVDPDVTLKAAYQMTSDEFFSLNKDTFDLVFVDGLHHHEQVERDIINSLSVLNDNGAIVVHDCNPTSREMQAVPPVQRRWTGDVWKAWARLRAARADLEMHVVNVETGCGVIRKGRQELITLPQVLTYETLDNNRQEILNLIDFNTFLQQLNNARQNATF